MPGRLEQLHERAAVSSDRVHEGVVLPAYVDVARGQHSNVFSQGTALRVAWHDVTVRSMIAALLA
jgi:hypothetical protein